MKKFIVLAAVAVLVMANSPVSANMVGMWWQRGDAGSTYQDWTFDTGANPASPENTNNPNATATIGVVQGTHVPDPGWKEGPVLGRSGVWAGDPVYVDLYIPNVEPQNPYKDIWMTLEYYGQITVADVMADITGLQVLEESTETLPDLWKRTSIHWRLEPNPIEEWIHLELVNSGAYVDFITVDTICWVPEPGTLSLLGLGGLLIRRKK